MIIAILIFLGSLIPIGLMLYAGHKEDQRYQVKIHKLDEELRILEMLQVMNELEIMGSGSNKVEMSLIILHAMYCNYQERSVNL